MSKSNIMVWLSRREEKKVLNLCKNHLDKIVETVKEMARVVHSFCDEDFNAFRRLFPSGERRADVDRKLSGGAGTRIPRRKL